MRLNKNLILKEIAGEKVVLPLGLDMVNFNGIITLNETAAYLWELCLDKEINQDELIDALMSKYAIEEAVAKSAVDNFINTIDKVGCLDE